MKQLSDGTLHDLDIIIDVLVSAFDDAKEHKRAMMTLQSHVGSTFHDRVERVYAELLKLLADGEK